MFEQWEFEKRWWKRRSWVHSLHMRGLLGHSAGVARLIIAAQSGIEYIYDQPLAPPLSPLGVRAAGIFRGVPSARCQYLFGTFIGFANERQFPHRCVEPVGARSVCGRPHKTYLFIRSSSPPRRVVSIPGSCWQNVNSLDYSGVVEEPIEARRMTLSSDTTSVRVSYVMLSSQASCARICVRDNACISGWRILGGEMLLMHYITLLHSSHIIKTAASVQAGLPFSFYWGPSKPSIVGCMCTHTWY